MSCNQLCGRIALVTGASRGIGAAVAKHLAQKGAKVIVNYLRNHDKAHSVASEINKTNGHAIALQADVGNEKEFAEMLAAARQSVGAPDILVLNADSGGFRPTPFLELGLDAYESRLQSEMRLAITPTKVLLPDLIAAKQGSIIAISSALCRSPVSGFSTIAVSKAALESFIRAIAVEAGPSGVRANIVEASLTETETSSGASTPMLGRLKSSIPLRRVGRPDDVAGIVAFLASDDSGFVNGATIPVNGGQLMY